MFLELIVKKFKQKKIREIIMIAGIVLFLLIMVLIYFLPIIVAFLLHKKNKIKILLINLLLGWIIIGWSAALV